MHLLPVAVPTGAIAFRQTAQRGEKRLKECRYLKWGKAKFLLFLLVIAIQTMWHVGLVHGEWDSVKRFIAHWAREAFLTITINVFKI